MWVKVLLWCLFSCQICQSNSSEKGYELVDKSDDLSSKNVHELESLYPIINVITNSYEGVCSKKKSFFADCYDNALKKWRGDDTKKACCRFWETDICVQSVLDKYCSDQEYQDYVKNDPLNQGKATLQEGYCEAYPYLSDCDFPILMVFAIVAVVVVAIVLLGYVIVKSFIHN